MLEAWRLFTQMDAAAAFALVGIAAAVSIPFVVRRVTRTSLDHAQIRSDTEIKLSEIKGNTTKLPAVSANTEY